MRADGTRWRAWWPAAVLAMSFAASIGTPYALGLPWAALALLCLLSTALAARRLRFDTDRVARVLSAPFAPLVAGILTALVVWLVWGTLRGEAVIHDEASYLFQAQIFAKGRWSFPSPPLPEFFEQYHVLVVPRYLSKYDPGHALLLTLGVLVGLPGLVPVALSGVAGGFVYALVRRLWGPWVALLTWEFWVTAGANLRHRPTYLSEVTTSALILAAWWALLEWRSSRRAGWLVVVAILLSWGAITRPVTMLAVGVPIGIVVIREVIARRSWRQLIIPAVAGGLVLGMLPVWNSQTLGDWRNTPRMLYTNTYLPFDVPGYGPVARQAERTGPPDFPAYDAYYRSVRAEHTLSALPFILGQRLKMIGFEMWGGWRAGLAAFAAVGLVGLMGVGWFAVVTGALLVLAYLTYYAPFFQLAYYLELQPVLALLTVLGLWTWARRVLDGVAGTEGAARFAILVSIIALWPAWLDTDRARHALARESSAVRQFRAAVEALPAGQAIVFLRYPDPAPITPSVMGNEPDLQHARVWVAYDRGEQNRALERIAPERIPYVYDVAKRLMLPPIQGRASRSGS